MTADAILTILDDRLRPYCAAKFPSNFSPDTKFEELGIDSRELYELDPDTWFGLHFTSIELESVRTVGDLIALVQKYA